MRKLIKRIVPQFLQNAYKHYKLKTKYQSYQGDKVFCPICKSKFKMFAPFGVVKRQNSRCTNCGSRERHRLIYLYLTTKKNLFDNSSKLKLLHFAPEKSFYNIFSQKQNLEYVPCDLFPDIYDFKGNTKVQKVDITKIPYEESSFDVILCNHVLEHIPEDTLAMKELYRVMKQGGWGIFQVPIDYKREKTYEDFSITSPKEREIVFGQHDHVRWYGQDYKDRLQSAGFKVTADDFVKRYSDDELFHFGLDPSHIIYYCEK